MTERDPHPGVRLDGSVTDRADRLAGVVGATSGPGAKTEKGLSTSYGPGLYGRTAQKPCTPMQKVVHITAATQAPRSPVHVLLLLAAVVIAVAACAYTQHEAIKGHLRNAAIVQQQEAIQARQWFERLNRGQTPKLWVALLRMPGINALALGERHFGITRDAIATDNLCLLWGIAAHEVAHDLLGHPDERVGAATGIEALGIGAGVFMPGASLAVSAGGAFILRAYSREQESQADARAIMLLEEARLPRWMLRYSLEFIRDAHGDGSTGWLATHPLTSERIAKQPQFELSEVGVMCPSQQDRVRQIEQIRTKLKGTGK